jgi:hypothetical protein
MAACKEPTANRKYGECDLAMAELEHNHSSCTCAGVLQMKRSLAARFPRRGEAAATGVVAKSGAMLSTVLSSGRLGHWRGARRTAACCRLVPRTHHHISTLEVLTRSKQNGFCWHDREEVIKRRPAQTLHMINLSS